MSARSKKVASKKSSENTELQTAAPSFMDMSDSRAGMEGTDKESFAIPFLRVIQKTSAQVDEASAEFIKGAKPGMLFNSVSGELYDGETGVLFCPCAYQRRFIQWGPLSSDRGFGGEYYPENVEEMKGSGKVKDVDGTLYVADEAGKVSEKNSDVMVDTRSHFGLLVTEGECANVLLSLSSTQVKKSKQLMTILDNARIRTDQGMVPPPTWMNMIRITTALESNSQGSWYGIKFTAEKMLEDESIYNTGKAFYQAILAGEAGAKYETAEADATPAGDESF